MTRFDWLLSLAVGSLAVLIPWMVWDFRRHVGEAFESGYRCGLRQGRAMAESDAMTQRLNDKADIIRGLIRAGRHAPGAKA